MSNYKTILLATDLSDQAEHIAARAVAIGNGNNATLHVIHVVEPLNMTYGGDIPMDFSGIQEKIQKQTDEQLTKLCQQYAILTKNQYVVLGRPSTEIHKKAEELSADLIVIGSHGRHGLALLLGSTASAVLHGASCDVLAVRIDGKPDAN